jgi:pimeloyl-ACP methyl ester carboxylesterase
MLSQDETTEAVTLADGRALSYVRTGAETGPVVVVLDGPCSRGLGRAAAPTARELGISLLVPDRPGALGSTPQRGRRIAGWPADHLALLDALGVEHAGILAQSGGTPYGIAVAAAAPERTTGLALLGALAPLSDPGARREAGKQLRTGAFLARRLPFVLRAGLSRAAKRLPDSAIALLPEHERPMLDDPWVRDIHLQTSSEILGDRNAMIDEIRLLARPWSIAFPPAGAVPTALWTGELDTTHPPSHARRVAALLGGDPPVTTVPGAATFGLLEIFPDALRFAAGISAGGHSR